MSVFVVALPHGAGWNFLCVDPWSLGVFVEGEEVDRYVLLSLNSACLYMGDALQHEEDEEVDLSGFLSLHFSVSMWAKLFRRTRNGYPVEPKDGGAWALTIGQTESMVRCNWKRDRNSYRLVRSSLLLYFQNEKHLKTPKKNERRYGCTIAMDVTLILSRTLFATFASSIIELAIIESLFFGVLLHV